MFFQIKTKIRRLLAGSLNINRPTSYPFITGDGFRALAQHVFDELSDIKPETVDRNDIVFVRSDFLKEFFLKKQPFIKNKYILISHNHDINITEEYKRYINDKIIHWFAQNILFVDYKITPIPIGITNYHYSLVNGRGKINDLQEVIDLEKINKRINQICFGFSVSSNPTERVWLKEFLEKNRFFKKIEESEQKEYFNKLADFAFTVSPVGNGVDCYRTWEALYLKVIPILKKGFLAEYFQKQSIPFFIVDDWNDLCNFNESFLIKKYDELKGGFEKPEIYMDFWVNLILSKKIRNEQ